MIIITNSLRYVPILDSGVDSEWNAVDEVTSHTVVHQRELEREREREREGENELKG